MHLELQKSVYHRQFRNDLLVVRWRVACLEVLCTPAVHVGSYDLLVLFGWFRRFCEPLCEVYGVSVLHIYGLAVVDLFAGRD